MRIDGERLWNDIEALSRITDPERPWTRRSFTPRFLEGRAYLEQAFRAAGLATRIDAGGNLIGRREGSDPSGKPILIGSHSDTVPSGGRYDGILGVTAALETARALVERGIALRHPLEVCDFLAEEPSEFGLSCVGSRALSGQLTQDMLAMTRPDGMTLRDGLRFVGGDPEALAACARAPGSIAAFCEVHIEQGRVLESERIALAAVTDIVGIARWRVVVSGRADHAGATPMVYRSDALVGAAALVAKAWEMANARASDAQPLVATFGQIAIAPNAANAVPGEAVLTLEARCGDEARMAGFCDALLAACADELAALRVSARAEKISHAAPTPCAGVVREAISAAARDLGLSIRDLPSGAGHDAVWISRLGPVGMIFTPCREGRSHAPEESMTQQEAVDGTRALARTVLRLDAVLP